MKKIKQSASRRAEFGVVYDGGDVNETPDTDANMLTRLWRANVSQAG